MTNYPTYEVTITRDPKEWVAVVTDGLPAGLAGGLQFDRFAEIHEAMRELVADLTDQKVEDFFVEWVYDVGPDSALIAEYLAAREQAAETAGWYAESRQKVVNALSPAFGIRTIGDLLGISPQRVAQLRSGSSIRV